MSASRSLLEVTDLAKHFGGIKAVDGLDFTVEENSITGLIGPNGAGKTTCFRTIAGFHDPDGGTVRFDGRDVTGADPTAVVDAGITRTFQEARTFPSMTVFENLLVGAVGNRGEQLLSASLGPSQYREDERRAIEHAEELLAYTGLESVRDQRASELGVGERKLVEITRALMTDPELILLDEPMAGLPRDVTEDVIEYIERLRRDRDQTFLIVEHDMDVIMSICDRITVMESGTDIASGTPAEIKTNDRVVEAYLGADTDSGGAA
ncbi:ABC transporter ATP-binding protein [Salinirubellus salinus]|uniref:Probable branched-chain amino acid transport ATP-binding protein LivG n=1 Tax=Salinirubellus salinus TaxID=1364945 RepID=A0A9E7R149_9EURY|nr:ABC transporter ATP-binding protein [Salinirubellus salinus]UWM53364.1 ABC transporter ATP-binding protein [Salinirubellus salinus]